MQTRAAGFAPALEGMTPCPPAARPLVRAISRGTSRRVCANAGRQWSLFFADNWRDDTPSEYNTGGPRRRGLALSVPIHSWPFRFDTAMLPHANSPHSLPAIRNGCANRLPVICGRSRRMLRPPFRYSVRPQGHGLCAQRLFSPLKSSQRAKEAGLSYGRPLEFRAAAIAPLGPGLTKEE